MDINKLQILAIFHFMRARSNCKFIKIYTFTIDEEGNYVFYGLYKCKRRVMIKKVILTIDGEVVAIISL